MAHECYYVSLKSLGRKEETALAESSRPYKLVKKGDSEAVMILSASAEEHGRPLISLQAHGGVVAFQGQSQRDYVNY